MSFLAVAIHKLQFRQRDTHAKTDLTEIIAYPPVWMLNI